ncbi:hypothetical protein ILUMI_20230 [Ignelater luminosus]|uniref:Alpha-galactosidase n=1 Tax=Ignelater luminosus TaxID=2038154 RepID=A0A8K0G4R9_IGNLU|nr:hypothetical protein ILUMI_20230 [Ignelater luminosus]
MFLSKLFLFCLLYVKYTNSLENGLARRPPMGWLSWAQFGCATDCKKSPNKCISDKLIRRTTDAMVSQGYLKAGYEYVIVDDCWFAKNRDKNGRLQPDPERFPHGMKDLANYIHDKQMKFGIYEDIGTHTCAGYPGLQGHFQEDAKTFAEWEIDYIKVDGCYMNPDQAMINKYVEFGDYLNKTGRSITYSCSWPAYMPVEQADYSLLPKTCNLWRNAWDIGDSWSSISGILKWFARRQDIIAQFAGPGHWNDPDMLIIGNNKLTPGQSKAQMSLWAILAAPLLMSADLDLVSSSDRDILQNRDVIAINQDELGIQGLLVKKASKHTDVWTRKLTPIVDNFHSYAIAFLNKENNGADKVTVTLSDVGLTSTKKYFVCEVFKNQKKPHLININAKFTVKVNSEDVRLYKAIPATPKMLNCKKHLTCSKFQKDDIERVC